MLKSSKRSNYGCCSRHTPDVIQTLRSDEDRTGRTRRVSSTSGPATRPHRVGTGPHTPSLPVGPPCLQGSFSRPQPRPHAKPSLGCHGPWHRTGTTKGQRDIKMVPGWGLDVSGPTWGGRSLRVRTGVHNDPPRRHQTLRRRQNTT